MLVTGDTPTHNVANKLCLCCDSGKVIALDNSATTTCCWTTLPQGLAVGQFCHSDLLLGSVHHIFALCLWQVAKLIFLFYKLLMALRVSLFVSFLTRLLSSLPADQNHTLSCTKHVIIVLGDKESF